MALEGGAAPDLFLLNLPRRFAGTGLNNVGAVGLEETSVERPTAEQAVQAACPREGPHVARMLGDHARGKWRLYHDSAPGRGGKLELDLDYTFLVPLRLTVQQDWRGVSPYETSGVPTLDIRALAAVKLTTNSRQADRTHAPALPCPGPVAFGGRGALRGRVSRTKERRTLARGGRAGHGDGCRPKPDGPRVGGASRCRPAARDQ